MKYHFLSLLLSMRFMISNKPRNEAIIVPIKSYFRYRGHVLQRIIV